jgi:lipid-A-disaccharide synthase
MLPKIGILAGGGLLPELIIRNCQESGREFYVIAFDGQAKIEALRDVPHSWVRLGAAGRTIHILRKVGAKQLVLAGTIKKPSLAMLWPDIWTVKFLARTKVFNHGDNSLLGTLIRTLEDKEGFSIVGAEEILPGLLAKAGVYGNVRPNNKDDLNIKAGVHGAQDLGRQDLGQCVIARSGQVLLSEDSNGTDSLLIRAREFRLQPPDGVLVKVKKPGQEHRVDLPTIGPKTLQAAALAGLRGIAIEAKGTLVLDLKSIVQIANKHKLFIKSIKVPPPIPLIFVIAGEPSGDLLGARLMEAMRIKTNNKISFAGIGGNHMKQQGLVSIFPMSDLSVMGVFEIIPRLPQIIGHFKKTIEQINHLKPSAVVTIDSPDFNFRIAKKLKNSDITLIHYVAPSVWAWRPKRAAKIAKIYDHLMTLLPFEPTFFEVEGLPSTFVGHSVLDSGADSGDGDSFKKIHKIPTTDKIIIVLFGSRIGEISALAEVFKETLNLLKVSFPNIHIIVPTVPNLAQKVRNLINSWDHLALVIEGESEKFDAFAAADVAIAASGTVALELAMSGTPAVIAYKTNPLTWLLARWLVRVRFANLVNLILNREKIPEFLQKDCRADLLASKIEKILKNKVQRKEQIQAYEEALKQLKPEGGSPAEMAASTVLDLLKKQKND